MFIFNLVLQMIPKINYHQQILLQTLCNHGVNNAVDESGTTYCRLV